MICVYSYSFTNFGPVPFVRYKNFQSVSHSPFWCHFKRSHQGSLSRQSPRIHSHHPDVEVPHRVGEGGVEPQGRLLRILLSIGNP